MKRGSWLQFPGRLLRSRVLASLVVLSFLPQWAVTRLTAWETLRQTGSLMKGTGMFLASAGAPLSLFPWYYDETDYRAFMERHDPFEVWKNGDPARAKYVHIPPWEPGVAIALKVGRDILRAPLSLVTLAGIQLGVDLVVLAMIGWISFQFGGAAATLMAVWIYAGWSEIASACVLPFYYYWPIPFSVAFVGIALMLDRAERRLPAILRAAALGLEVGSWCWFRGTAVSVLVLTPFAAYFLVREKAWRGAAAAAAFAGLAVVIAPAAAHNLPRSGAVFPRTQVWHDLYIGIGTRPNPYGIRHDDTVAIKAAMERHGRAFQNAGYEESLRAEYLAILRRDPGLIFRNFVLNFWDSLRGWSFVRLAFGVERILWLLAALGVVIQWIRHSREARAMTAALVLWCLQCATLSLVGRPQPSYLWETLGIAVLCGAAGGGVLVLAAADRARGLILPMGNPRSRA